MSSPASSGKIISALVVTGALVTGYILKERKVDRLAATASMKAVQARRDLIAQLKDHKIL